MLLAGIKTLMPVGLTIIL